MTQLMRFTSSDLELMPDNGKRYEIVDGELFVSKNPDWHHQQSCSLSWLGLHTWSTISDAGIAIAAPGLIFTDDNDVIPDVVWISRERFDEVVQADGKLHAAPDLAVEVLSPGSDNERRDRQVKLGLYSRQGVREYWILDWRQRTAQVYRRSGATLVLVATLTAEQTLTSPMLPGFAIRVGDLFPPPGI